MKTGNIKISLAITFCFVFTVGCSTSKNLVKKNEIILSVENKKIEPKIKYSCESLSFSNSKILIVFKKTNINQEEKITQKQYDLIEERTLQVDNTEYRDNCCLYGAIFPLYLPYMCLQSIDRDLGIKKDRLSEIINLSEQSLEIANGYIEIVDENERIPIVNNKAIIDADKIKSKNKSYAIKLFENDSEKMITRVNIEYEGEIENQYLVGKTGDLEIEIRSVFGSNAAFVAKLSNASSSDVELNSISDKIYFVGSDGMQVEGELDFYYSEYFKGNYPSFISANTFIAFNIETKQAVTLSESKAAYQIDSNNTRLKLLPNKDTRKIKDVRLE